MSTKPVVWVEDRPPLPGAWSVENPPKKKHYPTGILANKNTTHRPRPILSLSLSLSLSLDGSQHTPSAHLC